ncbi:MAG: bifunctional (p)ppGpp synthetase/guanosine-3',5'-bis(diphosphate) 3'-pyrophosphohydrolase [Rickettsiales bacterium]|nr:bifunctional (p)ppGpp synthetase/guanosine-3',5'-bis(diphosphate) 3'-pyrophosphohydrolase [Rickettsiales bacterium]
MVTKEGLVDLVSGYIPEIDKSLLMDACNFSEKAHSHQKRASGEPYFQHPLEVSEILATMKLDLSSIITGLLHDTVEDTEVTLEDITGSFGEEVASLVDGVTKLTKIEYQSDQQRQAENFRKLLIAMSKDIRVLLIKLADRLHNMRTIGFVKSRDKRLRISHETMDIYSPLAERLGIQHLKNELQDLAFQELYPDVRLSIIKRLEFLRKQDETMIERVVNNITDVVKDNVDLIEVTGRQKTPCSIWRKMESKNIGFEQLSDIVAFRIIVENIDDCYKALGAIHNKYHMVPDSFKDYISTPKNNGYQSLHTVVMGPERQVVEVQIRTAHMHEVAEYGVAAHWSYKQKKDYSTDGKQFRWMRELLEILERAEGPEEFLEHTKLEMYYDQVFCFTPKGDLIAMPKGATPVDFAYSVHSDVGHNCVGAKINGRIVPLRTELNNGDQVEIITSRTQVPSPSWEKFVVTGKARSEIRRFVRQQQRTEYINLGKAIINKAFREEGREYKEKVLETVLEHFNKNDIEELYAAVGEGNINKNDVIATLFPDRKVNKNKKNLFSFFRKNAKSPITSKGDNVLPITGLMPGMALHFAGCCHPLPGEKIVGIVNTGKGVTIHTTDCEVLSNYTDTPERWIDVGWDQDSLDSVHIGRLKLIVSHESGSLASLSNSIAKDLGNINNLKIITRSSDFFEILVDVEVKGTRHMTNIISSLRSLECVHSVERYKD